MFGSEILYRIWIKHTQQADVVISESRCDECKLNLAVAKKPVVFVPYPLAAEDHQTANAKYLVDREAALMVKDSEVTAKLFGTITMLATNVTLQEKLINNIAKHAVTNADEIIAKEILASL
jgi:UDP-N-acetylglucosamine--N-acetylmuramyl-(pentapeptide) pyrophosphoryl-undecaprenol N-acetylglucosamine transferase